MAEDKNKELKMDDLENVAGGYYIKHGDGDILDYIDPTPALNFGPFCNKCKANVPKMSVGDLCPICGEVLVDS